MAAIQLKPMYCRGQFLRGGEPVTRAAAQHYAGKLALAAGKGARGCVTDSVGYFRVSVTRG